MKLLFTSFILSILLTSPLASADEKYKCKALESPDCKVTNSNDCIGGYSLVIFEINGIEMFLVNEYDNAKSACETAKKNRLEKDHNKLKESVLKALPDNPDYTLACNSISRKDCRSASVHCAGGHILELNGSELIEFSQLDYKNSNQSCSDKLESVELIIKDL